MTVQKDTISLNPQYFKDSAGKKMVVLQKKEFDSLMELIEELEDIRLYDEAKKGKQEFIDAEETFREIEQKRNRK